MEPLEWSQVQTAVEKITPSFKAIAGKYRELKPYMVFASSMGQAMIESEPSDIVAVFPAMIVDSPAKKECLLLAAKVALLKGQGASSEKIAAAKDKLREKTPPLRYHSDTFVELRFVNLRYTLIWELQKDPLVDRELTPQSRASIRIALGTLEGKGSAI